MAYAEVRSSMANYRDLTKPYLCEPWRDETAKLLTKLCRICATKFCHAD